MIPQTRKDSSKGEDLCIFIRKDLNFKLRNDLDKFDNNIETLSIEYVDSNLENIVGDSGIYKSPRGKINAFKDHFRAIMSKDTSNKRIIY